MTGERIVFCVLAIIALCFPMKAKAQALPELPSTTVSQLRLLNTQGEEIALNSVGARLGGNLASTIMIFEGLYRTLTEWNNWVGGDDYIVNKAYILERQNMPAWLAEYSGDVIFWEIEYFGTTIEMLTDDLGNVLTNNGNLAMNLKIKNIAYYTAGKFMAENNNSVANIPVPQGNTENVSVSGLKKPYITGKELHFYIYINGQEHQILLNDFSQCLIGCGSTTSQWGKSIYLPCFAKLAGSSNQNNIIFYDETAHTTLTTFSPSWASVPDRGSTVFSIYSFQMPSAVMPGQYQASPTELKYFIPATYRPWTGVNPSIYMYWNNGNPTVNGFAYNGDYNPLLYTNTINALYLDITNGQEVVDLDIKVPQTATISAESAQEIIDAIAEIEPVVDPVTGIEIIEIPQIFPVPEAIPLEVVPEAPIIPPGIEDFPQNDPEIAPPYDPSIDPATTPTEDTLPDSAEQIQPMEELQLVTGLQNRFPFSIPWDIYNAYKMLQAERQVPHWEWEMSVNLPGGQVFTHTFILDLEFIDPVVGLFRDLFLLAFILGLAIYSYNKFFGGGA